MPEQSLKLVQRAVPQLAAGDDLRHPISPVCREAPTTGTYDLVVGADGISSTVRALTLSARPPAYTGAMAWRSVAPIRPRGLSSLQFHLGEGCFFGLCPVGDGRTYGFGNITEPRTHEPMAGRLDRLRRRFADFAGIVQDYLGALECDEHCGAVDWLALEQWHVGRVVLIGDAALTDDGSGRLHGDGGFVRAGRKPAQRRHTGKGP